MMATRGDGVEVYLRSDGTWTEVTTTEALEGRPSSTYGTWTSEYDYDRRTVTLSRAASVDGTDWRLGEVVLSEEWSDLHGRFEVFVVGRTRWEDSTRAYLSPGEIVKVVAQLDDDGYFSAWHPDFRQDPIVCEGTLWGIYYRGCHGKIDSVLPRHWIYTTRGEVLKCRVEEVRSWADAHAEWLEWRRR